MSTEHQPPQKHLNPAEEFGLTEKERLFDRVSQARLMTFLDDPVTSVHRLEESYNNYGEYLFVTLSRPGTNCRVLMTFYGLGYHEYRERWILDEWYWYPSTPNPELEERTLRPDEVKQQIEERYRTIQGYASQATQTRRGQIFEMIADLTDEDGAWVDMQDLPDWWLDDGEGNPDLG